MELQAITLDRIDADALKLVRRLVRHGHDAYLVGGVVRDLLVGREPKDWDITTSATPDEIRKLFRNCRIIGRRFRLAHIFFGPKIIETSTFRRHPGEEDDSLEAGDVDTAREPVDDTAPELLIRRDNVFGTAEEDARRRDFTINGLFYDVEGRRIVDHVGGLPDLERGVVRSIGDPDVRFREDPVRILRAIRMSARLGFEIEPETRAAMAAHRNEIGKCAPPRVLEELYRLFRCGASVRALELMHETGMLAVLAPELDSASPIQKLSDSLQAIDASVARQHTPKNAVILAILGGPLLDGLFDAGLKASEALRLIDGRFVPLANRLAVPRRERERARLLLTTVRRLAGLGRNRKPLALAKRDHFREAMFVFHAINADIAQSQESRWKRIAAGEPDPASQPPKKRRRRRRRGRRRTDVADNPAVQ